MSSREQLANLLWLEIAASGQTQANVAAMPASCAGTRQAVTT